MQRRKGKRLKVNNMRSFLCSDERCRCILTRYPDEGGGFWWGCNGPRCQRTYGDLNGAPDYGDAQRPQAGEVGRGAVGGNPRGYLGRPRRPGPRPENGPAAGDAQRFAQPHERGNPAGAARAAAGGWQFKRLV